MSENAEFMEICRKYAEARMQGNLHAKELNPLYEACLEKGKSLGMTRYAIEEAIEKCLEERLI